MFSLRNQRPVAPGAQEVERLMADNALRRRYVDALMYMHDILSPYATRHGDNRLGESAQENLVRLVRDVLANMPSIQVNFRQMVDVREEINGAPPGELRQELARDLDDYLDAVLGVYSMVQSLPKEQQ